MDKTVKDILEQIEDAKKMGSEINEKKQELNDVFNKMDFTGFEGMRTAIDNINIGDKESVLKAINMMKDIATKL